VLFTEFRFLFFFAAVFVVYWALTKNGWRKKWLLLCSYSFYAAWDWRFLSLIFVSTAVDFIAGHMMGRVDTPRGRKPWLVVSLITNLSMLGFFKYFNFFIENAASLCSWLGMSVRQDTLEIVLPVGISFYTFQTLSYTLDIYRGQLKPIRSVADFALFVAFFPQLVAGPIVRASTFLPQLIDKKRFADVAVRAHLTLFLIGFVKKACISDHVATVVDTVFAAPDTHGSLTLWLGSVLYAIQIYCDFSGYTDMAIATAGLLGYGLTENFNNPYVAASVRDFWRRWHISLSTWFRDYVYIPLGGSRMSSARTGLNLLIVFLLCGLWHGASWNFVIWGLFHGMFLAGERWVDIGRAPRALRHVYLAVVVLVAWVLFRSVDLTSAGAYLEGMFGLGGSASAAAVSQVWWVLPIVFMTIQGITARWPLNQRIPALPDWAFALAYGATVALTLPWVSTDYAPFIYFQF